MSAEVVSWVALAATVINVAINVFGRPGVATKALEIEAVRLRAQLDAEHDSLDRAHLAIQRVFDRLDEIERRRRPR